MATMTRAELRLRLLDLHPVTVGYDHDGDGYQTGVYRTCVTCRVAAPCPTRVLADAELTEPDRPSRTP